MDERDGGSTGVASAPTPIRGLRGTSQSDLRARNERLVLTHLRRRGALAKSDIARLTGLSAQTVSVIMRRLEADGLLLRDEPVRGRIGQPSVPMRLAPDGAFFFGLKIGRRSVDLVLVDALGRIRAERRRTHPYPTPDAAVRFAAEALTDITAAMPPAEAARVGGLGVAMPFQLWNWASFVRAPQGEMDAWRDRDIGVEIAAQTGLDVRVQNDGTAACGAELIFGTGPRPQDFLYVFVSHFVGGGLVLGGRLFPGRTGNAAALGSMPLPGPMPDGARQLISVASLAVLEGYLVARAVPSEMLWETPRTDTWDAVPVEIADRWLDGAAAGIARAALAAAAVIDIEAVVIDGWLPPAIRADLARRTAGSLATLDAAGIDPPRIVEGSVGHQARSLGAAAIPLTRRYLVEADAPDAAAASPGGPA